MVKIKKSLFAFLLSALFLIAGFCSPSAYAAPFTLNFVKGSDFDTLDPSISRSRPTSIIFEHLFNTLVKWKDTKLSAIVPELAESWEMSKDNLTWTFRLKKGIKFHDNTPFNAEAVKFNFERILNPETGSPNRTAFTPIKKITVIDEYTVAFTTDKPNAPLLENLLQNPASISSPAAMKKWGKDYGQHPVGTGPYKLKEWTLGERCVIERSEGYFGKRPNPDVIIYRPVPEEGARVVELESGNADIVADIPPEAADRLKKNPEVKVWVIPSTFQIDFELNCARPPFNDVRVRKAVNYAVDRKAIVEKILGGYATVPDGMFTSGTQGYVKLNPYPYDPVKAKKLLAEAYPAGYKEKVVLWSTNGRYIKDKLFSEAVQGYLNQIGLQIEFRAWEWSSYQKVLYSPQPGKGTGLGSNDANMWLMGNSIETADWRLRRRLHSKSTANLNGYKNPRIDKLLDSAEATMNYEERMKTYGEIQRIFWEEDAGWLFLLNLVQSIGMQKNIKGLDAFAHEILLFNDVTKE